MAHNLPNSSSGHRPSLEMTLNIDPNKTQPITPMDTPLETPMHSPQDHRPQTPYYDCISNSTDGMASEDMANSSFSTCPETASLRSGTSPSSRKSSGTQTSVYSLPKGCGTNPDPDAVTEMDDAVPRTAICETVVVYQGSLSENGSSGESDGRDFEAEQIDDGSGIKSSSSLKKTSSGKLSLLQAGVGSYVSRRESGPSNGNDACTRMSFMSRTSSSSSLHSTVLTHVIHQKLSENNQNTDQELDGFPKSLGQGCLVSTNNHTTNRGLRAKGAEDTPFSKFSAAQLSQNQVLDFDVHAGPSTQAAYNEIIPKTGTNNCEAYAEARAKILKELTRPSKYHDLDMLERAFQDLRAARDGTDPIQLTNSNVALINRPSIGYNGGKSQELISTHSSSALCPAPLPPHRDNTGGKESPTNPGPPKIPTHGPEWQRVKYRLYHPKKASPQLIRLILRYYDFESLGDNNTLEDILELEKIFGLQDVEWDCDSDRAEELWLRSYNALCKYLTKLGYRSFARCAENHKHRLKIRPANHQDPPRLPKWLRIDYLKPCEGVDNHINLETNLNNRIQTGAGLWNNGDASVGIDCSKDAVGTLGPIMKSENNVYFGLTAGHVLPDGDRELVVKTKDGELEAILKVAERYLRVQGRPIGRLEDGDKVGYQDEVILLEIGEQDLNKFNTILYCVNCHYYKPGNVSKEEASDPIAYSRGSYLFRAIEREGSIKVYKFGSATGLTTGHLIEVEDQSPPGWFERANEESEPHSSSITDPVVFESDSEGEKSDSDDEPKGEDNSDEGNDGDEDSEEGDEESEEGDEESEEGDEESEEGVEESKDSDEEIHDWNDKYDEVKSDDSGEVREMGHDWLGKIMWESKENPFSAPGDSGALVYALEEDTVIPLGVHLGSPSSWPFHSACLSIETFCTDSEKAGDRLRFAEAESRTVGEQAPSTSEEEEELSEVQLDKERPVQTEYMEAIILAGRHPSP